MQPPSFSTSGQTAGQAEADGPSPAGEGTALASVAGGRAAQTHPPGDTDAAHRKRVNLSWMIGLSAAALTVVVVLTQTVWKTAASTRTDSVSEVSSAVGSATSVAAGGGAAAGKIGVILPDTMTSRWETADRPFLETAFKAAGVDYDIQNALGDRTAMQTIADQMIANGATVLAIVNLDHESGAAMQKKAAGMGVQTIDYDRLTVGGSADYYVSFDNNQVGELLGEGLAKCLGNGDKRIVSLDGSPSDSNATTFRVGAHSVLDPMTNYTVVDERGVPDWDTAQARSNYEQMYTQQGGAIDGVLAANDGLGNAAIAINKENCVQIPVTGQDATLQGLQNVLAGDQCMTVYKPIKTEAQALSAVAAALANGKTPETTGTVQDTTGGRQVAAILHNAQVIYNENVKNVVDDGYLTAAQLCTGSYAATCAELGIS